MKLTCRINVTGGGDGSTTRQDVCATRRDVYKARVCLVRGVAYRPRRVLFPPRGAADCRSVGCHR